MPATASRRSSGGWRGEAAAYCGQGVWAVGVPVRMKPSQAACSRRPRVSMSYGSAPASMGALAQSASVPRRKGSSMQWAVERGGEGGAYGGDPARCQRSNGTCRPASRPAMDRYELHPDPGLADPAGRLAQRPPDLTAPARPPGAIAGDNPDTPCSRLVRVRGGRWRRLRRVSSAPAARLGERAGRPW